ncbi:MAG TPA: MraY family glycosyltransferase [Anaerolineales bacterium]|nr:MraY family glycosyltransferase [Anaerolineales bacterium]
MNDSLITRAILTAIVAGLFALVGTPISVFIAQRYGFLAKPKPDRFHIITTPMLGGLAIWIAFMCSLMIFGFGKTSNGQLLSILVGASLMMLVGMWDDRVGLGPKEKLTGQILAGLVLVLGQVQINLFSNIWLDSILTIFWVVAISNAINLQDNMDGLAAGISACASASVLVLAVLHGQVLVASVAAALMGACIGFLSYNFQPAITFMGDTGSLLLGFALAVLSMELTFTGIPTSQTWLAPILILGVPIFDTALVMFSRARRRVPFWQGGTDHTSHRLFYWGLSHRRAVIVLYAVTIMLGLIAVIIVDSGSDWYSWVALAVLGVFSIGMLWGLEYIYQRTVNATTPQLALRVTLVSASPACIPVLRACQRVTRTVNLVILQTPTASQLLLQVLESVTTEQQGFAELLPVLQHLAHEKGASVLQKVLPNLHLPIQINFADPHHSLSYTTDHVFNTTDLFLFVTQGESEWLNFVTQPSVKDYLVATQRARLLLHPEPHLAYQQLQAHHAENTMSQVSDLSFMQTNVLKGDIQTQSTRVKMGEFLHLIQMYRE